MNRLFFILLLLLCSCQAKEPSVQNGAVSGNGPASGSVGYEEGSQYTPPTPVVTPTHPLFSQGFEVDDDVFLNFQNCSFNTSCNIQIDYKPDTPVENECFYNNESYLCQDDLRNVSCAARAVIDENGSMLISNAYGSDDTKTAFCAGYEGLYTYILTTCRTDLVQKVWICGQGSQIYDLYWIK